MTALRVVGSGIRGFLRFWYAFIVGDDWTVAAAVVAGLLVTALLSLNGAPAWWVMPLVVIVAIGESLRRASHRR
ncbi:MAG TPA: hypothetical protein VG329_05785 [Candidatus Dormibacteraeota bacterium]|jgi:hypothetical protein|nr:hypothetical protein [Candidatus Dormibacteraeota bacterium]